MQNQDNSNQEDTNQNNSNTDVVEQVKKRIRKPRAKTEESKEESKEEKPIKFRPNKSPLSSCYSEDTLFEIGIDEAGRGPLFGRVYVAGVVLPKDTEAFHHEWMRDSKQIKNRKTMKALANYIKEHALHWHIEYEEAEQIDKHNILNAVMNCMHACAKSIALKYKPEEFGDGLLLVDGNYFKPCIWFDENASSYYSVMHETVEQGDASFSAIAAASILAKNERDTYVEELCTKYPILNERYNMVNCMGYGTEAHRRGIQEYGITQWHRKSFNLCKGEPENYINTELP